MLQMLHKFAGRLFKDYKLSLRFGFIHTKPKWKVGFILEIKTKFIYKKIQDAKMTSRTEVQSVLLFTRLQNIFSNTRATVK